MTTREALMYARQVANFAFEQNHSSELSAVMDLIQAAIEHSADVYNTLSLLRCQMHHMEWIETEDKN